MEGQDSGSLWSKHRQNDRKHCYEKGFQTVVWPEWQAMSLPCDLLHISLGRVSYTNTVSKSTIVARRHTEALESHELMSDLETEQSCEVKPVPGDRSPELSICFKTGGAHSSS